MKSAPATGICLLALVGVVGGVVVQHQSLSKLRAANAELTQTVKEVQRLSAENAEIARLRAEIEEVEGLRNETRELHRLRNEVRQLRELKPEWAKLSAENQRLRTVLEPAGRPARNAPEPENLIARESLSDAGLSSPEATLRTFFWALQEGNIGTIRRCFSEATLQQGFSQPFEQAPGGASSMMPGFKGLRVMAKKIVNADLVKLGIQISADGENSPDELVLPFRRVGHEWKVDLALP